MIRQYQSVDSHLYFLLNLMANQPDMVNFVYLNIHHMSYIHHVGYESEKRRKKNSQTDERMNGQMIDRSNDLFLD